MPLLESGKLKTVTNLERAHLSPMIGKHGKRKITIFKEETRDKYLKELEEKYFDKIMQAQFKEAIKRPNVTERTYVVSQIIGKPKETHEIIASPVLKDDT